MEAAALFPLLVQLAFAGLALLARAEPGLRPRRTVAAAGAAAVVALIAAIGAGVCLALSGPVTAHLPGPLGTVFSLRLDALSVTLLALVVFVGALVLRFSRNYLDGDARQGLFFGELGLTLAAVSLLVTAGNLYLLVAAWIATSLSLHRLLLFYPERRGAVVAARKKFFAARLGDASLIAAGALMIAQFGTADIARLLAAAQNAQGGTGTVTAAALLIAVAALLKSAQFPFHGWLPEVMETPTPVSALLHAGIINAGGFLVVRFAEVMLLAMPALHLLAVVGGLTALLGSVVMLSRTSIKGSLAWSTVAQMGFMLLQCGLGAFALAVLHLVTHGLYKAHAFLAAGSAVEAARTAWVPGSRSRPGGRHLLSGFAAALALYAAVGAGFGQLLEVPAAILALGAVLIMGLTLLIGQAGAYQPRGYVLGRTLAAAGAVSVAYFALHAVAGRLLAGSVPAPPEPTGFGLVLMGTIVAAFGLVTVLQGLGPPAAASRLGRRLYVHLANGLYANAVFDRLVGAFRRPRPSATSADAK